MTKVRILIADEIDTSAVKNFSEKYSDKFPVKINFGISNQEIINTYNDFDVLIIRSIRKIDKSFLDNVSFKIIATCSKGTDHIDVDYAKKKGIKILNAEEANSVSAAEHTLGLILAIEKNLLLSDRLVRQNKFGFYDYERNELRGRSIGIIGFGKVGSYLGNICRALGMNVYANDIDKNVRSKNQGFIFKSLNYILKNSDIISIHIPMNKKNDNFISKENFDLLKKDSVFINTSRGSVIEEKYLLNLLKNRKIKFAGLDVFQNEPLINRDFAKLDNVILTNHIAGKTIQSRRKVAENIFEQLLEICK